ncbi:MAG: hypothetical protein ABI241_00435 [Bacteroidia bacterium]
MTIHFQEIFDLVLKTIVVLILGGIGTFIVWAGKKVVGYFISISNNFKSMNANIEDIKDQMADVFSTNKIRDTHIHNSKKDIVELKQRVVIIENKINRQ